MLRMFELIVKYSLVRLARVWLGILDPRFCNDINKDEELKPKFVDVSNPRNGLEASSSYRGSGKKSVIDYFKDESS